MLSVKILQLPKPLRVTVLRASALYSNLTRVQMKEGTQATRQWGPSVLHTWTDTGECSTPFQLSSNSRCYCPCLRRLLDVKDLSKEMELWQEEAMLPVQKHHATLETITS